MTLISLPPCILMLRKTGFGDLQMMLLYFKLKCSEMEVHSRSQLRDMHYVRG